MLYLERIITIEHSCVTREASYGPVPAILILQQENDKLCFKGLFDLT